MPLGMDGCFQRRVGVGGSGGVRLRPTRGAAGAITGHRAIDEARQPLGPLHAVIEHELQPRRVAQPEPPSKLAAQEAGRVRQPDTHLLRPGCSRQKA